MCDCQAARIQKLAFSCSQKRALGEPNACPHKIWDTDPDESPDFKILKVGGYMKLSTGRGEEKGQQRRQPPFLPF